MLSDGRGSPDAPDAVGLAASPDAWITVVELRGDLDQSTAQLLRLRLDAASVERDLIVNLSAVPFIDSVALGMLAGAASDRRAHDRRVVLVGVGPVVGKVLAITRLGTLLSNVATIEAAEHLLVHPAPAPGAPAPQR